MTTKTIKTLLFASLIAAMILPFSGMDFAEAKQTDDAEKQTKIAKIKQSIKDHEKQEREAKDPKQKEKLKKTIDILNVIVDLEELDAKGLGASSLAKAKVNLVNSMIDEQYEKVQGTPVDPKDVPSIERVNYEDQFIPLAFASHTQYDTYTTSLQFTQSCGNTVTGQTDGYVNQYSLYSYILMNSDYPSSLHCDYDYKDTTVQYTKIGVGGTCAITLADNDGGTVFYCPNIGTNNDPLTVTTIFISANAYYDWGWLPFTATNGWTTIVYQ